jgi:hypothetical protein
MSLTLEQIEQVIRQSVSADDLFNKLKREVGPTEEERLVAIERVNKIEKYSKIPDRWSTEWAEYNSLHHQQTIYENTYC